MSTAPVEPRVADHFPRKAKGCEKPAEKFFACFSAKGEQPEGGVRQGYRSVLQHHHRRHICVTQPSKPQSRQQDKEAGRRGLAECRKEMAAYDACMQKWLAKNLGKQALFRVRARVDWSWVGIGGVCVRSFQSRCRCWKFTYERHLKKTQVQEEYRASHLQAKQQ